MTIPISTKTTQKRFYRYNYWYLCTKHYEFFKNDEEFKYRKVTDLAPSYQSFEPIVCREPDCTENPTKLCGISCDHNYLPVVFNDQTRSFIKGCFLCKSIIDVPTEQMKSEYTEHEGCGGLVVRWADPNTFNLRVDCTKCSFSEKRNFEDGSLLP
jgi:hypothetical protein